MENNPCKKCEKAWGGLPCARCNECDKWINFVDNELICKAKETQGVSLQDYLYDLR